MASSVKRKRPSAEDSIITVKQEHETGDSFITLKQQLQTTITVKQEHQTGDSVITLKHQHQTGGDSIITVKHENRTGDSIITVKKQQHPTGQDSFITVKIKTLNGRVDDFRVKRGDRLQRLMMSWRDRLGFSDYERVRFYFDGRAIDGDDNKNKTANDIGLKDGDYIDAVLFMMGD